jgi:carbon storage regulator
MLVLSRRVNESIVFPDLGITVRVVQVAGGRVRLGVEAPIKVSILRGELLASLETCEKFAAVVAVP